MEKINSLWNQKIEDDLTYNELESVCDDYSNVGIYDNSKKQKYFLFEKKSSNEHFVVFFDSNQNLKSISLDDFNANNPDLEFYIFNNSIEMMEWFING